MIPIARKATPSPRRMQMHLTGIWCRFTKYPPQKSIGPSKNMTIVVTIIGSVTEHPIAKPRDVPKNTTETKIHEKIINLSNSGVNPAAKYTIKDAKKGNKSWKGASITDFDRK
ncbi:unnamed protein product [Moneuplotes crassus]|uniref:Uncharacterized protein n=1 Tax=Euplotes crassus TaxID=5936 RepID=A0AAD1U3M2_EUPCR|nr:unnamed protein product [Moneuplotes crassus]